MYDSALNAMFISETKAINILQSQINIKSLIPFQNLSQFLIIFGAFVISFGQKLSNYKNDFKQSDTNISYLYTIYCKKLSKIYLLYIRVASSFTGNIVFFGN